jgi:hypothetical protein
MLKSSKERNSVGMKFHSRAPATTKRSRVRGKLSLLSDAERSVFSLYFICQIIIDYASRMFANENSPISFTDTAVIS